MSPFTRSTKIGDAVFNLDALRAKHRVVIVDDYALMRTLVRAAIEVNLGATRADIVELGTGREAISSVREGGASVVVLDLQLTDMDGLDVVRQLRGLGVKVPIVMVSSVADEARIAATLRAGAQAFVRKPFKVSELWKALAPYLGR